MIKKIIRILFVLSVFTVLFESVYAVNRNGDIKRVISIAYDDSWSMYDNRQDYAYASYSLQNLIALMNQNDKLNVVKMSSLDKNLLFHSDNYEKRKQEIEDAKSYKANAKDTTIKAVYNAVDYLYDMKSLYGNDSSYRYYLIVITDGQFDDYPTNKFVSYLNDVSDKFKGLSYNSIFIGIGDSVPEYLKNDVLAARNNYYVECGNNDDIVAAVFKTHDIIYNRTQVPIENISYGENKSFLNVRLNDVASDIIIFEQNQTIPVVDVKDKNNNTDENFSFLCEKKVEPYVSSYISHNQFKNKNIESKNITLEFLDDIDYKSENFKVLVEYPQQNLISTTIESSDEKKNIIDGIGKNDGNNSSGSIGDGKSTGGDSENSDNGVDGSGNSEIDGVNVYKSEDFDPVIEPTKNVHDTNNEKNTQTIDEDEVVKEKKVEDNTVDNAIDGIVDDGTKDDVNIIPLFPWWLLLLLLLLILLYIFWPYICAKFLRNGINDYSSNTFLRIIRFLILIPIFIILLILFPRLSCTRFGYSPSGWTMGDVAIGDWKLPSIKNPFGKKNQTNSTNLTTPDISPTKPNIPPTTPNISPTTPDTPRTPINPTIPNSPVEPYIPKKPFIPLLPCTDYFKIFIPMLLFAIIFGYIYKPRFEVKQHAIQIKKGKEIFKSASPIKATTLSMIIPYMAERANVYDLIIKAARKKDRVIVEGKYLTKEFSYEGRTLENDDKFILYEDMEIIKMVDEKPVAYMYKYFPPYQKNN